MCSNGVAGEEDERRGEKWRWQKWWPFQSFVCCCFLLFARLRAYSVPARLKNSGWSQPTGPTSLVFLSRSCMACMINSAIFPIDSFGREVHEPDLAILEFSGVNNLFVRSPDPTMIFWFCRGACYFLHHLDHHLVEFLFNLDVRWNHCGACNLDLFNFVIARCINHASRCGITFKERMKGSLFGSESQTMSRDFDGKAWCRNHGIPIAFMAAQQGLPWHGLCFGSINQPFCNCFHVAFSLGLLNGFRHVE